MAFIFSVLFCFICCSAFLDQKLCDASAGDVTVQVNPGCNETLTNLDCSRPWVIEVVDNSTEYRHLWGAVGAPTFITVATPTNSSLNINWTEMFLHHPESAVYSGLLNSVFGITLSEVILYDDPDDKGSIAGVPETSQVRLPTRLFEWSYELLPPAQHEDRVTLQLRTTSFNGTDMSNSSAIVITVSNSNAASRGVEKPRLQAMASSATLDLVLDNLQLDVPNPHPSKGGIKYHNHARVAPISGFTAPRWAVRVLWFSVEPRSGSEMLLNFDTIRSLDDEYAPGVFKLDEITTPRARSRGFHTVDVGGFAQWRPVCYLTTGRDVNKATLPNLSAPPGNITNGTLDSNSESNWNWFMRDGIVERLELDEEAVLAPYSAISSSVVESLAYAMMGDGLTVSLAAESLVSFGDQEDGYYTSWNYTIWTLTGGVGYPPEEGLSTDVLIVIIVGLGLPVLVMIASGVGLLVWRCSSKGRRQTRHVVLEEEEEHDEA